MKGRLRKLLGLEMEVLMMKGMKGGVEGCLMDLEGKEKLKVMLVFRLSGC